MMMRAEQVAELLAELDTRLATARLPVAGALRPGAAQEEIVHAVGDVPELISWWTWHDGVDLTPPVPEAVGPGLVERPENYLPGDWHLLGLAQAVRIHDWYRTQLAAAGVADTVPRSWFPLLREHEVPGELWYDRSGHGLFIVDMHADLPADPPEPMFATMADLVRSLIAWLARPEPGSRMTQPRGSIGPCTP